MNQLHLPETGKPAPDFTALNQDGESISLNDFRGKNLVLYFYPKAMTPGCTVQACGIRDTEKELADANTVVAGISPDAPARLQKFIEKHDLNFTLLSDEEHKIADDYGVWGLKKFMGKEFMGIHRITFIIDGDGVLRHIMSKVKTKTHHEDLLEIIAGL